MLLPNPHIRDISPARHGGIDYTELEKAGIAPEKILDFSVCTNPFGPPDSVREALTQASLDRYPDSESTLLRTCLGEQLNLAPERILIGSGSTELIRLVACTYLKPGDSVLVIQPTYGEYELASRIFGARIVKFPLSKAHNFRLDISNMLETVFRDPPRCFFLCNPNNPTGQYLLPEEIETILSRIPDSLLVLDEAYLNFCHRKEDSLRLLSYPNLVIIRSMTKDYSLAGLRLGYLIASEAIISALRIVKPPWNVSSPAQSAGLAALKSAGYPDSCRQQIQEAQSYLTQGLQKLGLSPAPTDTHFFLVEVGQAAAVRQALFKKGILVRDCTSFGLPSYLRLSTRTMPECARLLVALKEIEVKRYAG